MRASRIDWLAMERRLRAIVEYALASDDAETRRIALFRVDACIGARTGRGCVDVQAEDVNVRAAHDEEWALAEQKGVTG